MSPGLLALNLKTASYAFNFNRTGVVAVIFPYPGVERAKKVALCPVEFIAPSGVGDQFTLTGQLRALPGTKEKLA